MPQSPSSNPALVRALYVNAALLAALVVAVLVSRDSRPMLPMAFGQPAPQPIAGGAGLFLMPAQFSSNSWGCYIMDVDTQVLAAYTFDSTARQLVFQAARNFTFDRQLRDYNTGGRDGKGGLHPSEVEDLVKKERQLREANMAPPVSPAQPQ